MKYTVKKRSRFLALILSIILVLSVTTVAWATESKAAPSAEANFEYTVNSDNTVTITKYKGTEKEVVIPDTIAGKTVTLLGDESFNDCLTIESVFIPAGIKSKGTIESDPSFTPINMFRGCVKLLSIEVATENTSYTSVNGVLFSKNQDTLFAYPAAKQDKEYTIPQSVHRLGRHSFEGNSYFEVINFPDQLYGFPYGVFYKCVSLKEFTFPKILHIGSIAVAIFNDCTNLEKVIVNKDITSGYINDYFGDMFNNCPKLTIYGYEGSYAEEVAKKNNTPFVTISDASLSSNNPDASVEALVEAGTTLSFYEITSGLDEDGFNNLVKDAQSYTLYNISLKNGEREVQPITGNAKVRFKAPEGYTADSMKLYRMDNDAAGGDSVYTQMATTFENGFVNFETEHFSSYVLLNMGGESTTTEPTTESTTNGTTVPNTTKQDVPTTEQELTGKNIPKTGDNNVTAISAVVAVAALGVIVLLKKKSKVTVS